MGRSMSVNAAIHHSSRKKKLNFRCLQNTAKKVHSLRVGRRAFQGLGAESETALKPNCFSWALPPTLTMHKHDCEEERKGLTGEDNSSGDTLHHHYHTKLSQICTIPLSPCGFQWWMGREGRSSALTAEPPGPGCMSRCRLPCHPSAGGSGWSSATPQSLLPPSCTWEETEKKFISEHSIFYENSVTGRERDWKRESGGEAERLTETQRERFPTKTSKSTHCSMVWVLVSKVSCMTRQAEASMPPCCIKPPLSCTPTPRPVVHDRLNRLSASPAKNSGYNKLKTRLRKDLLEVWGSNIAQSVICERERREKKLNTCAAAELTRSREAGV